MKYSKLLLLAAVMVAVSISGFKDVYSPKYKMANDVVIQRNDGALYLKGIMNFKFKNDVTNVSSKSFNIAKLDNLLSKYTVNKLEQRHPLKQNISKRMKGDDQLARIFSVYYSADRDPSELAEEIFNQNKDLLDWAEPDYVYTADFTPNDPQIGNQYHIPKIAAYTAWNVTQGDTNVVIGMVDTGSDLDHPDLAANIKYNYAENPTNGVDDDNNGYIDDYRGWDFAGADYHALSEDNNPNITTSYCEHGSHTSGCASEVTNNGVSGAGIGFKCKLLISKHGADNDNTGSGSSYLYRTDAGIVYLYQNGVKVINCSFGGTTSSGYTQLVINNAWDAGVVMCASAGNDGSNVPRYPASYTNVVSVASTDNTDHKSWFSNYHSTVDVCAPGSSIYSTVWNNSYASWDGTSMSSPICAGTVALIFSKYPAYTPAQVTTRLFNGCDNIYGVNPSYVGLLGAGRINAYNSVQVLSSINPNGNDVPKNFTLGQNYPNPFNPVTKINFSVPKASNVKLTVYDMTGKEVETIVNETKAAGNYTANFNAMVLSSGAYFYKLTAGSYSDVKKMMVLK
jgi:serine protease